MMKEDGPPTSNKWPEFHSFIRTILLYIVCKFQANLFRQSFDKKYISMVILFDVGGLCDVIAADNARREDLKFQFSLK